MSFRNVIRSRFKKSETFNMDASVIKEGGIRPGTGALLHSGEDPKRSRSMECLDDISCDHRLPHDPEYLESFNDNSLSIFVATSDGESLEMRNKELQMQLLSATITNQNLLQEIKSFKEKRKVDKLEKELKEERQRYEKLVRKFKEFKSEKSALAGLKLHRPKNFFSKKLREGDTESLDSEGSGTLACPTEESSLPRAFAMSSSTESLTATGCTETAQGTPSTDVATSAVIPVYQPSPQTGYLGWRWISWFRKAYRRFLDDFRSIEETTDNWEDPEGEPLAPKRLKDNISRFTRAFHPISSAIDGLKTLLSWRSPTYTLMVFLLFMYAVWTNWQIPLILSILILRLSLNYLKYRLQWAVDVHLLSDYESEEVPEKDSKVTAQISFVVHVARKCQNIAGDMADVLEKLNNLLTWRCPEYTVMLMKFLILLLILSVSLSTELLLFVTGIYLIFKLFIVDYLFMRFPRLRLKYDSFYQLWVGLPTNGQFSSYTATKEVGKYILYSGELDLDAALLSTLETTSTASSDHKPFFVIFNLPHSECPLPSWKHGKRCILLNKDKSISNVFKHGKLYLTRSFLCFERQKDKEKKSRKHVVIPLCQITRVEKTKPFSWMPGVGMALEISINGLDKPLVFGSVLGRDEIYEGLMQAARHASLSWAALPAPEVKTTSATLAPPSTSLSTTSSSPTLGSHSNISAPSPSPSGNGSEGLDNLLIDNIQVALFEDTDSD